MSADPFTGDTPATADRPAGEAQGPDGTALPGEAAPPPRTPRAYTPLFGWLWRSYLHRHRGTLLAATLLMSMEGAMLGLLSYLIKPMFDRVFIAGQESALYLVGFGIMGIFIVRAVAGAAQKILLKRASQKCAAEMRIDLLDHLMGLDTAYHQINPPGRLIEWVQSDVTVVNNSWASILVSLGRDTVSVVVLFGVALTVDWQWTLVTLVGVPFLVAPALLAQRYVRKRSDKARDLAGHMSTRLDEVFHGINPIKLNALEDYQSRRYRVLTNDRARAEVKATVGQATVPALVDVVTGLGFLAVMIYGGGEIISGEKTVGEFMSFFTAIALVFDPLRRIANTSGQWQIAAASIHRLRRVLAERATLTTPAAPRPAPTGAPEIVFEDVRLNYGDLAVLKGAAFRARAGETTAFVGASGGGKSTVFNVLTRLVEHQSGRVTIDGIPVADMALPELRGLFSVVTQDAALFDESLRDNILLGRTDVTDARLEEVLRAAHVLDFLPQLPDGLDSPAGPRGSNLSGGQRQRVAIARALLRDTPILLLDEATSALDTKSEALVQDALNRLSVGRTTLVIAHRLSTVRDADSIVVMDRGRVADQGTHAALLDRDGIYADLHRMQFKSKEAAHD
ncbi:ABC transporter ATP-binding protein [Salipiger sp. IMCC34102]|uniref:ABC transporter ATP-binding protein n=1 Tax=Salipiger sp. IMCC34102 TaxID=2510647 RepID=UPI00101B8191|nr:ABC transporter ATP-binding protein [Salipiger sp. IMCC34102]RYH02239.1 ABC transporter ATP-binding protein [Salipiger sp. IMCC34102]